MFNVLQDANGDISCSLSEGAKSIKNSRANLSHPERCQMRMRRRGKGKKKERTQIRHISNDVHYHFGEMKEGKRWPTTFISIQVNLSFSP